MKPFMLILMMLCLTGCFDSTRLNTGLEGKPIPSFDLLLPDSTTHFNTSTIPEGKPFVLFYFAPSCPFCKAQMEDIIAKIKTLRDIQIYILTPAPHREAKAFFTHFNIFKYPNLTAGEDYSQFLLRYFNAPGVPLLFVYDKKKLLTQVFCGKTPVDIIKKAAFRGA